MPLLTRLLQRDRARALGKPVHREFLIMPLPASEITRDNVHDIAFRIAFPCFVRQERRAFDADRLTADPLVPQESLV